jgi:hypothetical protein
LVKISALGMCSITIMDVFQNSAADPPPPASC